MITLKGLALSQDRIQKPLLESTKLYKEVYDIDISWDFKNYETTHTTGLSLVSNKYDILMVNSSQISDSHLRKLLVDLKTVYPLAQLDDIRSTTTTENYDQYSYNDSAYAIPIDLSAQVSAYVEKSLPRNINLPTTFGEVKFFAETLELKGNQKIALPFTELSAYYAFYTICSQFYAEQGCPAGGGEKKSAIGGTKVYSASRQQKELNRALTNKLWHDENIISYDIGTKAIHLLSDIMHLAHKNSYIMDSVQLLDYMSTKNDIVYCPIIDSFSNYTKPDYVNQITFSNIPLISKTSKIGKTVVENKHISTLSSFGIAISETTQYIEEAANFLEFISNQDFIQSTYFESGGQPANLNIWNSPNCNERVNSFFKNTLESHVNAISPPRFPAVQSFELEAGDKIRKFVLSNSNSTQVLLDELNMLYNTKKSI